MNMHNIYYIIIRTTFRGTRFNKKVFKAPCSFSRARNLTTIEEKKGKIWTIYFTLKKLCGQDLLGMDLI
jgi:hypothetical protein